MRYEPAGPNPLAQGCQTGTYALGRAIRNVYPELQCLTPIYGCFNRRRIEGSRAWSLHAEGRAVDTGVRPAWQHLGWHLACTLVEFRTTLGTMRVMWDGHIWSTERPDQWRKLGPGTHPHLDHVHVEQFWRDARRAHSIAYRDYEECLSESRRRSP